MLWLFIAITSYICFAISSVFVKYLVSRVGSSPKVFVFYMGVLGMFVFFLVPFVGFVVPSLFQIGLSVLAGFMLAYSTLRLLEGLQKFEASRIVPAVGGLVPLFTFVFVFILSKGEETFSLPQFFSFAFLVGGIMLLTVEKGVTVNKESFKIALMSAFFLALSFVATKYVYLNQSFWSGLIFMRLGGLLLGILLLIFSGEVRKEIFHAKHQTIALPADRRVLPQWSDMRTPVIFLFSQMLGALAEILRNGAVFLVPLAMLPFVNALQGVEYAFLLVFVFVLSRYFPRVLKEETAPRIFGQKILAIACILAGLVMIAFV